NFCAPRITSRVRSCCRSNPPAHACPILRARNSISAASSPSTKFSLPSKPSLAKTFSSSHRSFSAPNRFPPQSSARSTVSRSTAPACPVNDRLLASAQTETPCPALTVPKKFRPLPPRARFARNPSFPAIRSRQRQAFLHLLLRPGRLPRRSKFFPFLVVPSVSSLL